MVMPKTIGRYEILEEVGRGSMGVVYSKHSVVSGDAVLPIERTAKPKVLWLRRILGQQTLR